MEEEYKQITLRVLINDNTNLLTVAGIFNALAIYTSSIPKYFAKPASFILLLLSLMILAEVVIDCNKLAKSIKIINIERLKLRLFFWLMIAVEAGLAALVLQVFSQLTYLLFAILGGGILGGLGGLGSGWIINQLEGKKYKTYIVLFLFLLSLALIFYMFHIDNSTFSMFLKNLKLFL